MIQGNGTASPAWMIMVIMIILYLYHLQLVPISYTPISREEFQLIAQLFVNDTDLNIENNGSEMEIDVINRVQLTLMAWHQALVITRGELKLEKCY